MKPKYLALVAAGMLAASQLSAEEVRYENIFSLNRPQTIEQNGTNYVISIVGGNSQGNQIVLDVNGNRKVISEAGAYTVGNLEMEVEDILVLNTPEKHASALVSIANAIIPKTRRSEARELIYNQPNISLQQTEVDKDAWEELRRYVQED